MAVEIGALRALLSLDSAAFEKGAKRAKSSMSGLERSLDGAARRLRGIGTRLSLALTAPLAGFAALSTRAANRQIQAERQLSAALEAAGISAQRALPGFKDFAAELQKITTVGDEVTLQNAQVAISMGLTEDQAKRASKNAIGLSKAFGINEKSAIRYTAALEKGDTTMLNRYIPTLRIIKDETRRAAEAQRILEGAFKVAIEEAKSGLGPLAQLKNSYGDFQERIGALIIEALTPMIDSLKGVVDSLNEMSDKTLKTITIVGGIAAALGPALIGLGLLASALRVAIAGLVLATSTTKAFTLALARNPIGLVAVAISTLAAGYLALGNNTDKATEAEKLLNEQLGLTSGGTDAAAGSSKNLTEKRKLQAEQNLKLLETELALMEAELQRFENAPIEQRGMLTGDLEAGAMRRNIDAARAEIERLRREPFDIGEIIVGLPAQPGNLTFGPGLDTPIDPFAESLKNRVDATTGALAELGSVGGDALDNITTGFEGVDLAALNAENAARQAFTGIVTGATSASEALRNLLNRFADIAANSAFDALFGGIFSGGSLAPASSPIPVARPLSFAGLFDAGGFIPRGQFGIAGERGPEIVTGPAQVTSRARTGQLLGGGGRTDVRVELSPDLVARVIDKARQEAVQIVETAIPRFSSNQLPSTVGAIARDPRRVG